MDAAVTPKSDADYNNIYGFYLKTENPAIPAPLKQRSTVIKYTKLPALEYETKVSWAQKGKSLEPRSRRLTTMGDDCTKTTRSLQSNPMIPSKMNVSLCKRKIVTITEDDENDLHPKFSRDIKKPASGKTNRSIGTDLKEERQCSARSTSRLSATSKYSKDNKTSAKNNSGLSKKDVSKLNQRGKFSSVNKITSEHTKFVSSKDKDVSRNTRNTNTPSKASVNNNLVAPSGNSREIAIMKGRILENYNSNITHRSDIEIATMTGQSPSNKSKKSLLKEIKNKNRPVTVIHVPIEEKYHKDNINIVEQISRKTLVNVNKHLNKNDCSTAMDDIMTFKNVKVGTEPEPEKVDRITDMDNFDLDMCKCSQNAVVQTDEVKAVFDSLEIPNVSLTKEKIEPKVKTDDFYSKSLPNLQSSKPKSIRKEKASSDINFCKSTSYIISHSTLTYTTEQKINFHLVESEDDTRHKSPSPLSYPMNVLSVYKNEIKKKSSLDKIINIDRQPKEENKTDIQNVKKFNQTNSPNCSYAFDSNKLMKPSDIISTISVNNGLLQSDYICEQFQRELNFIDSFFESLQYLESCSLSNKCFANSQVENLIRNPILSESEYNIKNSAEYNTLLSKFDNSANVDDAETMASKSLCLLNLLIHDEQRRAQSLLLVLKMRENALKHFTKSQVLWLENKKKLENTDISNLRKKQRGALVKLQHERGEMQRMRKALKALSEKRKTALMKTKKNIELRLKDNVDVEQILLGKKKLKRSPTGERNIGTPLKCFDLSSSGCEESTTPRPTSEALPAATLATINSAEKCIQTNDSICSPVAEDQFIDTAAENFVVVDGGYLNILFQNLSLPQIFSGGKQYEVNEEALKTIVNSANSHHSQLNKTDVVEKLMEQIKNRNLDKSSVTSTARSLVEEYDYYYKEQSDEEKSVIISAEIRQGHNASEASAVYEIKDISEQTLECNIEHFENNSHQSSSTTTSDSGSEEPVNNFPQQNEPACVHEVTATEESPLLEEPERQSTQAGPLPVPAGAAAVPDSLATDVPSWSQMKTSATDPIDSSVSSASQCTSATSISSMASPVNYEAEELRRQQLEIEREIKALEQQQCRLLVVREIPDKPPPPYTPPADSRVPKPPRMFLASDSTDEKIQRHMTNPATQAFDASDAFDMFVKDFCQESLERQQMDQSDMPWDACNLLPQKPQVSIEKLAKTTSSELLEVLTGVTPTVVSGVGARRSDHIDDILFAEWRRCEPEWSSLHTDEAIVKNQIFECIFQKILSETVDEYKKVVLPKDDASDT